MREIYAAVVMLGERCALLRPVWWALVVVVRRRDHSQGGEGAGAFFGFDYVQFISSGGFGSGGEMRLIPLIELFRLGRDARRVGVGDSAWCM